MRYWLLIVFGTLSGVAGGMAAGYFMAKPPAPPSAVPEGAARPPPIVLPPGWDPSLLGRVQRLEKKIDQPHGPPSPESATPAPSEPDVEETQRQAQRQREREATYARELAYREQALADHAREAVDDTWAPGQARGLNEALAAVVPAQTGSVKEVDCRSKTCTATLAFATPGEALLALAQHSTSTLAVPGCKGFVAIPPPPANNGAYDLTIIYNCR